MSTPRWTTPTPSASWPSAAAFRGWPGTRSWTGATRGRAATAPGGGRAGAPAFFSTSRAARARQLTQAFHAAEFPHFDRGQRPQLAAFATMTQYDVKLDVPAAFPPQSLKMILGEVLAQHNVAQLRTAETEKYAHVTHFFNAGNAPPFSAHD